MTGTYTEPAIPPYFGEIKRKVRVIKWLGDRVLLEEIENPTFWYDTDLASFQPDIPESETVTNLNMPINAAWE